MGFSQLSWAEIPYLRILTFIFESKERLFVKIFMKTNLKLIALVVWNFILDRTTAYHQFSFLTVEVVWKISNKFWKL